MSSGGQRPELAGLQIADPPEPWRELGFTVEHDRIELGAVTITLVGDGRGNTGWTLRNVDAGADLDGLATSFTTAGPPPPVVHPNGATALDHVVILTPDFDRTATKLAQAGMPLRRVRDAGGFRQGFRRLGPAIMEIVEVEVSAGGFAPGKPPDAGAAVDCATFWGLVVIVADLDAFARRFAPHVSDPKPAVQPGRRIATLRDTAKLTPKVAFMDPDLSRP